MRRAWLEPLARRTASTSSPRWISRSYAVQAPGKPPLQVFNRHVKRLQRERAAQDVEHSRQVDYLRDEIAARLCDRLLVRRSRLHRGNFFELISTGHQPPLSQGSRPGRKRLQSCECPHTTCSLVRRSRRPCSCSSSVTAFTLDLRRLEPRPSLQGR